jgi:hypothetical protein
MAGGFGFMLSSNTDGEFNVFKVRIDDGTHYCCGKTDVVKRQE